MCVQGMTERQYGRICNVTSVTGPIVSMAGASAYVSSHSNPPQPDVHGCF